MLNRAARRWARRAQMFVSRQPMDWLGTADEIGSLAVYLASDESAFTTGVALLSTAAGRCENPVSLDAAQRAALRGVLRCRAGA